MRAPAALTVVAGLAAAALCPPVAAEAARPVRCDQVGGRNLVTSTTIRVGFRSLRTASVERRTYYGCVQPRGRVFTLGTTSSSADGTVTAFALGKAAGRFLITTNDDDDAGGAGRGTRLKQVWDLASGRTRTLYRTALAEGDECADGAAEEPDADRDFRPERFVISAAGVVAGIYRPNGCGPQRSAARVLASVPGTPRLRLLDSGTIGQLPLAGLSVSGREVSWTKAGRKRSRTV